MLYQLLTSVGSTGRVPRLEPGELAPHGKVVMRFLNDLKIVLKVGLIVTVLGCALLGVAAFSAAQLASTVDGYAELSDAQSAALNLTRAQRRIESYHAALYATLTETTEEGNARRLKMARESRDSIGGFLD